MLRRILPALAGAVAALGLATGGAHARPLIVASISSNPGDEIALLHPMATYLAHGLREFGIDDGRVVVVQSIPQLTELLRARRADLFFDSAYPTLAAHQASGSRIILRRWKTGRSEYRSLILVRADSAVRALRDLPGRTIAFEDNYSTSGYFLPFGALRAEGLRLRELQAPGMRVDDGEVGYVFSGSYSNSLVLLLRARVEAAGVGVHDYERFLKRETAQLRVLHQTESVPRHLVSVRGDLPEALIKRIREILVGMEHSAGGREVLRAFEKTTRFDDPPRGFERALEPLLRMLPQPGAAAGR